MAGLNIILNDPDLISQTEKIEITQKSLNLSDDFLEIFKTEERCYISWNKYSDYPVASIETDKYIILVEGKIFNFPQDKLASELEVIFDKFDIGKLDNWLVRADGDFIVYLRDKHSGNSYIFNDILGRLPLYYCYTERGIVISRHIRFISNLTEKRGFDRISLAEYLILGYVLGERTLFQGIQQLRPATIIVASDENIMIKDIHNFNFEIRENGNKSFEENVSALSELLSKACIDRFNNGKTNLLALSSGLDSRTVAACMTKNRIPYETLTMVYENGHGSEEVGVAKYIAEFFKVKWESIDIPPPTGKHMFSLLEAKEGMSFLATAPMLPFYEKLRSIYDDTFNFITGDKSDKIALLYDIPVGRLRNVDQLIKHILSEHAMIGLDEACAIINIDRNEILNDFTKLLNSYPETSFSQKYIHFRAIEKSHKLAFHGDDRHKRYVWSYCPLTSSPLVLYAFNCPEKIKKMHKLFISLMDSYSPAISRILYTNFKAPVTSIRGKLFMWSAYYIYPLLPTSINNYIKNVFFEGNPFINEKSIFYKIMARQFEKVPEISEYLNIPDISYLKKYRMHMMSTFLTLTSVIEYFYSKESIFSEYWDTKFDYRE